MKYWVIYLSKAGTKNWVNFDDEPTALAFAETVIGVVFKGEFVKEIK